MEIHEIEKAEKQIRSAWIVGVISTGLTVIVAVIGTLSEEFRYSSGFDAWSLVDAALLAALSYGVYRRNRYAALALFLYFALSKIMGAAEGGHFSGGVSSLFFGYFLLVGTIAAFRLHKHKMLQEDGMVAKKRGVVFYASAGVGLVLFGLLALLLFYSAKGPGTEVLPGRQLKAEYVSFAADEGMLEGDERIQFWYSDGFSDFKDGFYFFTEQKVVLYNRSWAEPTILVPLETIEEIDFIHNPSFMEDSEILLYTKDSDLLTFPVSSDNDGDQRFYERLKQVWEASAKMAASETAEPAADEE